MITARVGLGQVVEEGREDEEGEEDHRGGHRGGEAVTAPLVKLTMERENEPETA